MSETIEMDHDLWKKEKFINRAYFWSANAVAVIGIMSLIGWLPNLDSGPALETMEFGSTKNKYIPIEVEKATFDLIQIRRSTNGVEAERNEYDRFEKEYSREVQKEAFIRAGNDSLELYSVAPWGEDLLRLNQSE